MSEYLRVYEFCKTSKYFNVYKCWIFLDKILIYKHPDLKIISFIELQTSSDWADKISKKEYEQFIIGLI